MVVVPDFWLSARCRSDEASRAQLGESLSEAKGRTDRRWAEMTQKISETKERAVPPMWATSERIA